jgi:hypothetical protein
MPNLEDYYRDLLTWEGVPHRQLIDPWPAHLRAAVENDLVNAAMASGLKGSVCPIPNGTSNQAIGNKVEAFTIDSLSPRMECFRLGPCSGKGYPDKLLTQSGTNLDIPLEMKATSDWNPRDSNRRVLTCSSAKLRKQFQAPIHHLLATVLYTEVAGGVRIDTLRLDFLEPDTAVSVRLEASVNHKILSTGDHHTREI